MTAARPDDEIVRHLRRLRFRAIRDQLRESLLFLPALMLILSVVIAVVLGAVDQAHRAHPLPWTFAFTPGTASTLLGIVAGAVITTAGVVFSLLVISLQLASGQFSPRVLRGFWRDRFGQAAHRDRRSRPADRPDGGNLRPQPAADGPPAAGRGRRVVVVQP